MSYFHFTIFHFSVLSNENDRSSETKADTSPAELFCIQKRSKGIVMIHEGFMFFRETNRFKQSVRWRCSRRRNSKCNAKIKEDKNKELKLFFAHNEACRKIQELKLFCTHLKPVVKLNKKKNRRK